MVMMVAPPKSSIKAVFERVGVYGFGEKRVRYEIHDEDDTMEMVQIGAERTKNVLILMSDTGGGHCASAEAIRDAFKMEFGDEYKVFVKDVWKEYTGWPLNDIENQYKFMVKHVQLWNVAFHGTSPRWIHGVYLAAIAAFYAKEVEVGLMEYKPDIIISVHPLMQHIPLRVLKWQGLQKKVIFVTVITDLNTCHRTWFHPGVKRCYCPSEEVSKRALLDLLEPNQVRVFGLPVRPSFARAVLNKVRGFETQMQKWMGACDCIITKAGPGTIAEALIRGLPIILNDYIPGQEKGNVPYVVNNGAGAFTRSPKETAQIVAGWFSTNVDELKRMSENALKLAQPEAVFDIVRDIHDLACQRGPLADVTYALTSSFSNLT
ncbi:monogalactosyldiacylglycerol synthase 2, chloroplastic-like isoform X2 [Bidens hawaiensis]|uniref:monogalactosyldiacylglycerol synthase 2, chloroplastic-like isoform X2 n=1 Tax=Bidens hawaiensis TaxID=980011 RepID=UPI004048FF3D